MSKEISIMAKKCQDKISISQDKLSTLAGIAWHAITKIESGTTPDSRIETVKKLLML